MEPENVAPNYDVLPIDLPLYRIDFWEEIPGGSWDLDTWLLRGSRNVAEVISWVHDNSRGRKFQVLVSTDSEVESSRMAVLFGSNPTRAEGPAGREPGSFALFKRRS